VLKLLLLTATLTLLAATGATSLALMSIEAQHSANRPEEVSAYGAATTHLLKLQDELALP